MTGTEPGGGYPASGDSAGASYDGPPPTIDPAGFKQYPLPPQPYVQPPQPLQPLQPLQPPQPYVQPVLGQPAYGPPVFGPGYPPYSPGQYPIYPAPQSNGLAVAALVTGICGFFCITSLFAIGLGIGGLLQSRRSGVGRAMSIWGICLGVAWLVLVIAVSTLIATFSSS